MEHQLRRTKAGDVALVEGGSRRSAPADLRTTVDVNANVAFHERLPSSLEGGGFWKIIKMMETANLQLFLRPIPSRANIRARKLILCIHITLHTYTYKIKSSYAAPYITSAEKSVMSLIIVQFRPWVKIRNENVKRQLVMRFISLWTKGRNLSAPLISNKRALLAFVERTKTEIAKK